jgi:hypothetical protein
VSARDEPHDRVEQSRESPRTAQRVKANFETPPPLRDRNMFFHFLLNGDEVIYERVRPRWREMRRHRGKAAPVKAKITTAVRQKVESEPGHRALDVMIGQEKNVKRSCNGMLAAIRSAHSRIGRMITTLDTGVSRSAAHRDVKELSKRLRKVRRHAEDLQRRIAGRQPFESSQLAKLEIGSSVDADGDERSKRYKELKDLLGSLETPTKILLRDVIAREKKARAQQ